VVVTPVAGGGAEVGHADVSKQDPLFQIFESVPDDASGAVGHGTFSLLLARTKRLAAGATPAHDRPRTSGGRGERFTPRESVRETVL
jgi:hypothetical protein